MNSREELVLRCAKARANKLGGLSAQAFEELLLAVRSNPEAFVEFPREQAFLEVVYALQEYEAEGNDEFMTDEDYLRERRRRFDAVDAHCARALEIDPECTDAKLLRILVADKDAEDLLDALIELNDTLDRAVPLSDSRTQDAWDEVLLRPQLRVKAAIARTYLETARFHSAIDICEELVRISPSDALGAHHTWVLALARLEDEEAYNELESKFSYRGNAWSHLAHALLLYKLGRLVAARRALNGFAELCPGGAYTLMRPIFVDTYLPDRPDYTPATFEESILAVHEADPIIVDSPDFVAWAQAQPGFTQIASDFASSHGFDW